MPPRTLILTLAYEGTHFSGWQIQKNSRQTIQFTLEQALKKLTGKPVRVIGSGRTDSGVHAQGQVAHAQIQSRLNLSTLHRALNATLPESIWIRSIREARNGFHAQHSAKRKTYRYQIWNRPERPLFNRPFVHHIPHQLDFAAMQRAARSFVGLHDFKAFHSTGRIVEDTHRVVFSLNLRRTQGTIRMDVEANGFLYHMVRRMAGLLIEIGQGKIPPKTVASILKGRSHHTPPTAPAKGLTLLKVTYG